MVLYEQGVQLSFRGYMQALIFDLDDTLYDLSRHRALHLRRAWAEWFAALEPAQVDAIIAAAVTERIFFLDMPAFLARHGVTDAGARARLVEASRDTWFADLVLDDGVAAVLDTLAGQYRLGLITNGPADIQGKKITRLGLARWFEALTVSQVFGVEKPDPRIFVDMLGRLGTSAEAAVMIGDNPAADIAGAHGVGMRAVWIRHPHIVYPAVLAPPWRVVRHVTQVPAVLAAV